MKQKSILIECAVIVAFFWGLSKLLPVGLWFGGIVLMSLVFSWWSCGAVGFLAWRREFSPLKTYLFLAVDMAISSVLLLIALPLFKLALGDLGLSGSFFHVAICLSCFWFGHKALPFTLSNLDKLPAETHARLHKASSLVGRLLTFCIVAALVAAMAFLTYQQDGVVARYLAGLVCVALFSIGYFFLHYFSVYREAMGYSQS
uniref:hypothetical protein n=1 Tax=Thaumasiovibrio occultus TaxID=1891184 RepID=UPI000B3594AA|nr:hypothetical protein [Thaumasiovibrio occultus]